MIEDRLRAVELDEPRLVLDLDGLVERATRPRRWWTVVAATLACAAVAMAAMAVGTVVDAGRTPPAGTPPATTPPDTLTRPTTLQSATPPNACATTPIPSDKLSPTPAGKFREPTRDPNSTREARVPSKDPNVTGKVRAPSRDPNPPTEPRARPRVQWQPPPTPQGSVKVDHLHGAGTTLWLIM
ncbi:hypothetical protein [Actinophytocola sp.]|uniref:hypothetical protein n=1 Tax=Actinophytocola sp. TaxID=1872138 RepID=UPI002ED952AD